MDEVYGAVVMLPAAHLEPGTVEAYGAETTGHIDVGRYPDGRRTSAASRSAPRWPRRAWTPTRSPT